MTSKRFEVQVVHEVSMSAESGSGVRDIWEPGVTSRLLLPRGREWRLPGGIFQVSFFHAGYMTPKGQ